MPTAPLSRPDPIYQPAPAPPRAASIRRVHFIEYNAKVNTLALKRVFPKYGTPLLASLLRERGYEVRIFLEGVSGMSLEKMTDCDAICFPVFAPALNKVTACARRIRQAKPGLPIIMGGPHVCLFPETVVDACDYAVRCEGDEVLPELLECLSRGGDPRTIRGISFREDGRTRHNPDRPPPVVPDTIPDFGLIEGFDRATRGFGRFRVVNTLQTSRGCHFKCSFCPTAKLFGGTYRNRSIDSVVRDIRARRRINPLFLVVDNSFMGNRQRAAELLHRLARENLGAHLIVFERHEIGRDTEMLELMKRAGVRCLIVGIESLEDKNLQAYHKRQTSSQVVNAVETILRHDIHVIGTFVVGGDNDTRETGDGIVEFVQTTGVSLNLFIVHDLEEDESKGLFIPLNRRFHTYYQRTDPANTDFYDYLTGSFVTYFPKRMKPSTLQESVLDIYDRVFTHGNIIRRVASKNIFAAIFGIAHGYGIKRMNDSIREVVENGYLDHLKQIEEGLYDEHEVLREDRLASRSSLPVPPPLVPRVDYGAYEAFVPLLAMPGLIRYGAARLRWKMRQAFAAVPRPAGS